jgi:hypothetical protein
MKTPYHALFAAAFFTVFLGACAVQQNISLRMEGSGSATLSVELHPVFMEYYKDLASGFSSSFDPAHPRFFDLDSIKNGFSRNPELQLLSAETPEPGRLNLEFRIRDISGAIKNQDPGMPNIISREKTGNTETLRIYLDRNNLSSLLKLIPEAESPAVKILLPPENSGISEEEYLDHLAWALEDYAKNEKIEDILRAAGVHLTIKTPGKILSQTGGTLKNDSEVLFQVPILRLFTLQKPVDFSISYPS